MATSSPRRGYKPLIVSGEALKKLAKKGKLRAGDLDNPKPLQKGHRLLVKRLQP